MKIALVTATNADIYDELEVEANARGHELERIVPGAVSLTELKEDSLFAHLSTFDLVYYRAGFTAGARNFIGAALKQQGVQAINIGSHVADLIRDKAYQTLLLAESEIHIPQTVVAGSRKGLAYEQLHSELGSRFVVKPVVGSGGKKVELIESKGDFESLPYRTNRIYQTFIPHEKELRCNVIGEKHVVFECRVGEESFKANQSFGGQYCATNDEKLVARVTELTERIDRKINLDIYCVDFLLSTDDKKLYLNEVNFDPGWTNLIQDAGINLPKHIMDYFESLF